MSLLLDALKRAEQEKLARQATPAPAPAPSPAAAPAAPASAAAGKAALELQAIDTPAGKAPASPAPAASAAPGERSGAQVVFAAKREEPQRAGRSKAPIIAVGVVGLLLLAGGGGYVWYQLQALSPTQRPLANVRPVTPAPPASPAAAATTEPVSSPLPLAMLKPGEAGAEAKKARPAPDAAEQAVLDLLSEARNAPAPPPLRLTRSLQPTPTLADVTAGYEALRRGDAAGAKSRYEAALAIEARNLDALLGLATAEARLGNRDAATRLYRRSLEVDPRNASALAGLAALTDFSRPDAVETQLRADLMRYPQSAALHFTMGNLLASRLRWADAQAAYFEAHRLEPANPDIAYNLAVALDQIGQPRTAAEFYARALAQAKSQAAQFDTRAAARRLAELRP